MQVNTAVSSLAVAVVAFIALFMTSRDAGRAQKAAYEESRRNAERVVAALDREQVLTLARLHVSQRDPNIYLNPLEQGQIGAALDALPELSLPRCCSWVSGKIPGSDRKANWQAVRDELAEELRRLTKKAATSS